MEVTLCGFTDAECDILIKACKSVFHPATGLPFTPVACPAKPCKAQHIGAICESSITGKTRCPSDTVSNKANRPVKAEVPDRQLSGVNDAERHIPSKASKSIYYPAKDLSLALAATRVKENKARNIGTICESSTMEEARTPIVQLASSPSDAVLSKTKVPIGAAVSDCEITVSVDAELDNLIEAHNSVDRPATDLPFIPAARQAQEHKARNINAICGSTVAEEVRTPVVQLSTCASATVLSTTKRPMDSAMSECEIINTEAPNSTLQALEESPTCRSSTKKAKIENSANPVMDWEMSSVEPMFSAVPGDSVAQARMVLAKAVIYPADFAAAKCQAPFTKESNALPMYDDRCDGMCDDFPSTWINEPLLPTTQCKSFLELESPCSDSTSEAQVKHSSQWHDVLLNIICSVQLRLWAGLMTILSSIRNIRHT
jgi:hypothetical protein